MRDGKQVRFFLFFFFFSMLVYEWEVILLCQGENRLSILECTTQEG